MLPKHIYDIDNDKRRAFAPYNFVELPEKVVPSQQPLPSHNRYYKELHTGKISCTLTTSSPLYIRGGFLPKDFAKFNDEPCSIDKLNALSEEARKRRTDFFQYPKAQHPTIPGSSLRGLMRSLVEVISYGKIDKVTNSNLVYRAVGDMTSLGDDYRYRLMPEGNAQQKAGYLIGSGSKWFIKPAKCIFGASFARIPTKELEREAASKSKPTLVKKWHDIKNAKQIEFQRANSQNSNLPIVESVSSGEKGVRIETGKMYGKKLDCVFGLPLDTDTKNIPIPFEMVLQYEDQITKGQQDWLKNEKAALQQHQPIFYLTEKDENEAEKLVFFGHAMMFRLPYPSSVREFIPQSLRSREKEDINSEEVTDLAEAIFGYVREQKRSTDQAHKGRVFFSDAHCTQNVTDDIWLKNGAQAITPKILSSPKPTTFQHYLVQPGETKALEKNLRHYTSDPVKETVIRGHKRYWHQGKTPDIEADAKAVEKAKSQYTKITPIKAGVSFKHDIHFENLTDVELGALLWILKIAQKPQYRLSLGMGKPLGMGAIRIESDVTLSDRSKRYSALFSENQWEQPKDTQSVDRIIHAFEKFMLSEETGIDEVDHPINSKATSLEQVPRIQMLLAMLDFDDIPPESQRRYMRIEPRPSEYRSRPVLPTPFDVIGIEDNRQLTDLSEQATNERPAETIATAESTTQIASLEDAARLQEKLNRFKRL